MNIENRPFLGRGWSFPLGQANGDVALSALERNIREAITIILETAPGERVMRPDFGVGLHRMVCQPITRGLLTSVQEQVRTALLRWEPRIEVKSVVVKNDPDQPGKLFIDMEYLVRSANTLSNFVYPFYLQEARQS